MTINTTLVGLSTNPALNGPDGASDIPSQYDDAIRYALSFIASLRDGQGFTADALAAAAAPQTSVELVYTSATSVTLRGTNGGYIWINGKSYPIGSGITKTLPTLVTGTFYYVYAFWTGTAVDLEFSTTGFTKNANGIPQKNADVTRTIVGGLRTNSTTTTYNTGTDCGVISYWNRKRRAVQTVLGSGVPYGGASDAAILTGPTYLSWGDEISEIAAGQQVSNTVASAQMITSIYVGGAPSTGQDVNTISGAGGNATQHPRVSAVQPIGQVVTAVYGRVNTGVGTWSAGSEIQAVFNG